MRELVDEICKLAIAARETELVRNATWHSTVGKTVQLARDVRDSLNTIASSLEEIALALNDMKPK